MKRWFLLSFTIALLLAACVLLPSPKTSSAAAPDKPARIGLYRYQSKSGSGVYAAQPAYRNQFEKASPTWDQMGVVGYVYPTKQSGTMPLLSLRKSIAGSYVGIYFYTTDINEAIAKQNAGWNPVQNFKGVIGYVAMAEQPGTIAVYRYRQPTLAGGYIYAFGEAENDLLAKKTELKFEKLAFYVWEKSLDKPKSKGSDFPTGDSTVDLSLRAALYANGANSKSVNTSAPFATPEKSLVLKKSDALECAGLSCTFNLAFYIFRNSGAGTLTAYARIGGASLGSAGNTFIFAKGKTTKDVVLPVKLGFGENTLKVTVDPFAQVAESNENNNSFTVKIVLQK